VNLSVSSSVILAVGLIVPMTEPSTVRTVFVKPAPHVAVAKDPSRRRSSPITGFLVARPLMKPTSPSSALLTISPAPALRLEHASPACLQPVSVSVRLSFCPPVYSPLTEPPEHVVLSLPTVSSVTAPSVPEMPFLGPGGLSQLYAPLPWAWRVHLGPTHAPVRVPAGTQRPSAGSGELELNSATAGRPMFPCSSIARIATYAFVLGGSLKLC